MTNHRKLQPKEVLLFGAPLVVVALLLGANTATQSAAERQRALLKQVGCSQMMYQADGSMKRCDIDHGGLTRRLTRWQLFVRGARNTLGF